MDESAVRRLTISHEEFKRISALPLPKLIEECHRLGADVLELEDDPHFFIAV